MKLADRKKLSVHLDMSGLKQIVSSAYPLSTKRQIETSPISPNTSRLFSEKKLKVFQPLHSSKSRNINTIQNIISNFKSKVTREKENKSISIMSQFPLSVDQFIKLYNVTQTEIQELSELKQVFYYKETLIQDDGTNGQYLCNAQDHIRYQYEITSLIGQGSFGQVFQVFDHKTKRTLALKIIRNQEKLKKQAQIEANLLRIIREKDSLSQSNIVRIEDQFVFRGHHCIVLEKLEKNFFELLKQQKFRGFDYSSLRQFALQILVALNYLQKLNIIHCDLKPENVMIQDMKQKIIKLVDFGSGCIDGNQMYTYIQSRYYRAPEVLFGLKYGMEIDMWSFGCLIAEMHSGQPIFPGENEVEQFHLIMELIGEPTIEFALKCPRKKHFFDENGHPKKTIKHYRNPRSVKLHDLLKTTDGDFVDFLYKCFTWDASSRMKPQQALGHPWLQGVVLNKSSNFPDYTFIKNSKTQSNLLLREFEKKVPKENIFLKLEQTRTLIANNFMEYKPSMIQEIYSRSELKIEQ
ncbi:unnamed protein product (macronuclear) [Paramecium tetraurelia]|uniref:Protein kinase domain-containing protein n=1 Tax=Paramecium tetraurelia TaxID=5888 RepID=A0D5Z4_PARTE|nr:uncharacterized protein GSPATT00013891001 [Paramecium tetraurelia]CAK78461.1 unnamed protein product [Paramecium tetraurelia]|eukprot:XP_001445858.1 hypothetical protein (macronuclear) [Paramecium tetraurelia strain d4-2]